MALSKRAKKVTLILGVSFILFVIFSAGAVYYTKQPIFCKSCHLMKPYYKGWSESAHKDVNCLKCHYEPSIRAHLRGKIDGLVQVIDYITGRYSEKPTATIEDASCLRKGCHDKEVLKNKKLMFKDKVEFHHKSHWQHFDDLGKGIELRCATCHSWLTYDKHMAVDENTCFTCHFKNVSKEKISQQCIDCHTETEGIVGHKEYAAEGLACTECHTTIKTTNAPVLVQMCYFCHADAEKIKKAGDRDLMHKSHIPENNADCTNCHELIEHGKE